MFIKIIYIKIVFLFYTILNNMTVEQFYENFKLFITKLQRFLSVYLFI